MPAYPGGPPASGPPKRPRTTTSSPPSQTKTVAASFYTGTGGGSCGLGLGMTFAELNMGHALGGLPCGTNVQVTYKGKTITVKKTDIGLGGPGVAGLPRAIDLYIDAARALGFPMAAGVIPVQVTIGGNAPASNSSNNPSSNSPSDSGQGVEGLFAAWEAAKRAPRGTPGYTETAEYTAYDPSGSLAGGGSIISTSGTPSSGATPVGFWQSLGNALGSLPGIGPLFQSQQGPGKQLDPKTGKLKNVPQFAPTAPGLGGAAGFFGDIGAAINSALDFLKWIAWIFHPVNLLRGVEFLTGIGLMIFGMHATIQATRESRRGGYRGSRSAYRRSALGRTTREVVARSPAGTASRRVRGATAGRRSARREQRYREYDRSYRSAKRSKERKTRTTGKTGNVTSINRRRNQSRQKAA